MKKNEDSKSLTREEVRAKQNANLKIIRDSERAKELQKLSAKAKSRNAPKRRAYKEEALKALNSLVENGAMEDISDIEAFKNLKTFEKLAIIEHLRDSSGQKPKDIPEAVIMPVINIKGL